MAKSPKQIVVDDEGDGDQTGLTAHGTEPAALSQEVQDQLAELAALKAAQAAQPIRVQKAGDFNPDPVVNKASVAPLSKAKRIRIILEDNEAIPPTGLFIQPNGRPYLLMPSVEVDVPVEVISVLNDAITEVAVIDNLTMKVVGFRKRLRFPYQVVPSRAA